MIFKRNLSVLMFFLIIAFVLNAQVATGQMNASRHSDEISDCIINNAQILIGRRYLAGSLEGWEIETLKYSDDVFDCVTFIEYVMARVYSKREKKDFDSILTSLRYRNGIINGYSSRLHYFSEWILENIKNGYILDVTSELGGVNYKKDIDFMSSNIAKFPKLAAKEVLNTIIHAEKRINNQKWSYIPKSAIKEIQNRIVNGDIIAITTNVKGLDITHTGFAINRKGSLFLIHASEKEGKVVISKKSLYDYLRGNKNQTGIIVLRCKIVPFK